MLLLTIEDTEFYNSYDKLKKLGVNILTGRPRDERDKKSIYFTDPDGHKFEFHTGSLQDRINYYKQDKAHMEFYYFSSIFGKRARLLNKQLRPYCTIGPFN